MLKSADTGIDWDSLVPNHTSDAATTAEQLNICWRTTQMSDSYCNQVLRATQDVEQLDCPSERAVILRDGRVRCHMAHWPILSVSRVQVAPANPPYQFTDVTAGAYAIRNPSTGSMALAGSGAYEIDIAGGFVGWSGGRYGWELMVTYVNGWPNAGLTGPSKTTDTSLAVDDLTGFLAGNTYWIYDGGNTEQVTVASTFTATTGPGNLPLASSPLFGHQKGVVVSGLPSTIHQACIYLATYIALTRGSTAMAAPPVGAMADSGRGAPDKALLDEAYALLNPYRRVW